MEPMTLGSPSSPGPPSPYLPSFLMGEANPPQSSRNTLSPSNKKSLNFTSSPTGSPDINRSGLQQKFLNNYQQPNFSQQNANSSISGPPTQGLFDCIKNDNSCFQTPNKSILHNNNNVSAILNQSNGFPFNESLQNQSGFNQSRIMSPIPNASNYNNNVMSPPQSNQVFQTTSNFYASFNHPSVVNNFWITVFGFGPTSTSNILLHFSQCGTIVDKVFAPQQGNWIHLRFSSRLECDKALNYNGKIICSIMIGVMRCTDEAVLEKENAGDKREYSINKIRPLAHIAYKNAQAPTEVIASPGAPKRNTGLVDRAMDLFFGW